MKATLICTVMLLGVVGCRLAPGVALSTRLGTEASQAPAAEKAAPIDGLGQARSAGVPLRTARAAGLRHELAGDFARAGAAYLGSLDDDGSLLADLRRLSAARVRVAPDGSGDFHTLAQALAAAEPFTTIVLAPGRYAAGLEIGQAVSIVAEGAERGVVEPNQVWLRGEGPLLTSRGPWLRLMGVGLSSTGPGPALQLSGGHGDLTDVTFEGGGLGVSGAAVFLSDSRLRIAGGAAVALTEGARATIKRTRFSPGSTLTGGSLPGTLPGAGLVVGDGCQVVAHGLRLQGLDPAVSVGSDALLTLTASDLYDSHGPGVDVSAAGEARLSDVLVRDGDDVGVLFRVGSRGLVERCRLRGNRAGQLRWEDGANVEQRDNVVRHD